MHNLSIRDRALIATILLMNATRLAMSGKFLANLYGMHHRYLENGLQLLSKAKILKGERGPYGGYRLAQSGDSLHFLKILDILQGSSGKKKSSALSKSSMLNMVDQEVNRALRSITIGELSANLPAKEIDKVFREYERIHRIRRLTQANKSQVFQTAKKDEIPPKPSAYGTGEKRRGRPLGSKNKPRTQ